MKSIFRNSLIAAALVFGVASISQAQVKVGNNPGSIHPSAALEVESTNKGFLPPRVALQSRTDVTTIPAPATGLVVYSTGSATFPDPGIYVWDGAKWDNLRTDGGSGGSSFMKVGETRTGLVSVTASTFFTGTGSGNGVGVAGTSKTWMNSINTTTPVSAKLLSEAKGTTDGFPVFAGLRLDFSSWGYAGTNSPAPKLVNTTGSNITYSISSLSTYDALLTAGKQIIVPGAIAWKVDGNDGFTISQNNGHEYNNSMVTIHKSGAPSEFYMVTWALMWVDTDIIGVMSVTRYY